MAKKQRFFDGNSRRKQAAVRKLLRLRAQGRLAHGNWGKKEEGTSCPVAAIGGPRGESAKSHYQRIVRMPKELVDHFINTYDSIEKSSEAEQFAIDFHRALSLKTDPARVKTELLLLFVTHPKWGISRFVKQEEGKRALALVLTLLRRRAAGIAASEVERASTIALLKSAKEAASTNEWAAMNLMITMFRNLDRKLDDIASVFAGHDSIGWVVVGQMTIAAVRNGTSH